MVLLTTTMVLLVLDSHEPTYQGKTVSQWLEAYHPGIGSPDETKWASEAVRAIGKDAIPSLLRLLQARDSDFRLALVKLAQKQHFIKVQSH